MTVLYCKVRGGTISNQMLSELEREVARYDGKSVEIAIRKPKAVASDPQRGYWFAVVCPIIGDELGYTKDETHDVLMWELLPDRRHVVELPNGGKITARCSWNDLTKDETSKLVEDAHRWAANMGIYIPEPGEWFGPTNDR